MTLCQCSDQLDCELLTCIHFLLHLLFFFGHVCVAAEEQVCGLCFEVVCVVCYSNGVNVEGAEHRYVVELIKQGGDVLRLTVISVSRKVRLLLLFAGAGTRWWVLVLVMALTDSD